MVLSPKVLSNASGGVINGVLVAGDEAIERRIERQLRAFVGCEGTQEVKAVGRPPKGLGRSVGTPDGGDPGHGRLQAGLAHFNWIDEWGAPPACPGGVAPRYRVHYRLDPPLATDSDVRLDGEKHLIDVAVTTIKPLTWWVHTQVYRLKRDMQGAVCPPSFLGSPLSE